MALRLYLKILAICYTVGFVLHVADLTDLRLKFSQMNPLWKTWIVFLAIADLFAAVALWTNRKWGIGLFIFIASCQLIAYVGFPSLFFDQTFLIWFHLLTVGGYLLLFTAQRTFKNV